MGVTERLQVYIKSLGWEKSSTQGSVVNENITWAMSSNNLRILRDYMSTTHKVGHDIVRSHERSWANTNELFYGSEIPCRASSDLHEWRNNFETVLRRDSAKLKWLWRCGLLTTGQKDPVELYCTLTLNFMFWLCSIGGRRKPTSVIPLFETWNSYLLRWISKEDTVWGAV